MIRTGWSIQIACHFVLGVYTYIRRSLILQHLIKTFYLLGNGNAIIQQIRHEFFLFPTCRFLMNVIWAQAYWAIQKDWRKELSSDLFFSIHYWKKRLSRSRSFSISGFLFFYFYFSPEEIETWYRRIAFLQYDMQSEGAAEYMVETYSAT